MSNITQLAQEQEQAKQRVDRFVRRFQPSYRWLAYYAALPLVLTPELLHYLRTQFLREEEKRVPWVAEVDLLLSDLCIPVGYEQYALVPAVRAALLEEAEQALGKSQIAAAASLLVRYVQQLAQFNPYLSQQELQAQQWAAMVYLNAEQVVRQVATAYQQAALPGVRTKLSSASRVELMRLSRITQELAPQLKRYPKLLEYAALVGQVLVNPDQVDRSALWQPYQVLEDLALRVPDSLVRDIGVAAAFPLGKQATFPQLEWFEFEVATVEIAIETIDEIELSATHRTLGLQPFEFEIATIGKQVRPPVEISDSQTALQLIDEAVYNQAGERLNDLQRVIFNQAWAGRTYREMGVELGYTQGYLQNQAYDLWKLLSQVTGRQVNKRTLQAAVMQWAATEISEWVTSRQQGQAWQFIEDLGNGVLLDMVQIPGGSFVMGSPEDEVERSSSEGPQHTVTLNAFFLGKYPVTQAQWSVVAALPQVNRKLNPDPSSFKGNDRPVEQLSWEDAVEFCDRLSQYTGKQYRLPSEAEWEYACRASPVSAVGILRAGDAVGDGVVSPFHFGETITPDLANYDGNYTYGSGPKGIYREETTPVGSFGVANAFGLYDMHGNVWEWCADRWHENYKGAPIDGSAWITGGERDRYVLRGGSWDYDPHYCRSACRSRYDADGRYYGIGFRVACSA